MIKSPSQKDKVPVHHAITETNAYPMKVLITGLMNADFLSKPVPERRDTLKEKGACWSCLKRGHRIQDCRVKKPCGVSNECNRFHHKTLHEEELDKKSPTNIVSANGTASVCNNEIETCLLQIQKTPTRNGFAKVLWDTGASICFITNAKARAQTSRVSKRNFQSSK